MLPASVRVPFLLSLALRGLARPIAYANHDVTPTKHEPGKPNASVGSRRPTTPTRVAEFLAHRRYFTPLASQTASEYRQVRRAASTALVATTPCSTTSWPAWQTTPGYHMALCGRLIDKGKTGQQPTVNTAGAHDAMLVENKCF
ncbi:uncharacterized protein LOC142769245 isoform X1 [Rhipicephalus microplus]|uniref:uncharacterized protein LOC142769245 isoform X1 n=1 Tax=Rhipicephalus microplus TaxID=6941 RepID=UPI003F6AF627